MARNPRVRFLGQIRALFDVGTAAGLTDGQLLERFATRRDEGSELAFAALVERHGPMVLRVCRGVLRDEHEAQDAFQATFLVLARQAGSLWVRDSLGPWLHRVACNAAGRARRAAARRRALEERMAEMAIPRDGGEGRDELASVVHEEVDRLPERFRAAVVLCELEGRTCEEAARHLGCPVGTLKSRLSRGRDRLRDRLRRRGLPAVSETRLAYPMPFPPQLVGPTAVAAARFVSIRAVPSGPAASLALEVLRTMAIARWWKLAIIVCLVGGSTTGALSLAGRGGAVADARPDDAPAAAEGGAVAEVKPGPFRVAVHERGSLESANSVDVFSKVEGQTTILSILPEGTKVSRGDVVCELDSAALKDHVVNQRIRAEAAEAAYQNAMITREEAEIALKEYVDGIYPTDLRAASNEVTNAASAIANAEDRLKRTRAAREQLNAMLVGQGGIKTPADLLASLDLDDRLAAAEQELQRDRRALEVGRARRDVLEKFTKDKMVKGLRVEAEKARAAVLARRQAWQLAQGLVSKLERQIESCKILAPADGRIVHANDPGRFGGMARPQIEEGAVVRERQKILSIPDLDHLRVNTKVHESIVDRIRPGVVARVRVDAFPGRDFTGAVVDIAPLPDPNRSFSSDVKVFTTHVSIDKSVPGLRPGMIAEVEILVAELEDVLTVPVGAVVRYDDQDHVAVRMPDGSIAWRAVTLGLADATRVEIKAGLAAGDRVALEPAPLLGEEQKRKVSAAPRQAPARAKAVRKGAGVPAALRAKLQAIPPTERTKLRDASPEELRALLKKAGLTDEEIGQILRIREQAAAPR